MVKPYPIEQASHVPLYVQVLQLSTLHPVKHFFYDLLNLYPASHEVESQNEAPFVEQAEQLLAHYKQVLSYKVYLSIQASQVSTEVAQVAHPLTVQGWQALALASYLYPVKQASQVALSLQVLQFLMLD